MNENILYGNIEWIINAFKMGGYVILFLMFFGIDANSFPKWFIPVLSLSFMLTLIDIMLGKFLMISRAVFRVG